MNGMDMMLKALLPKGFDVNEAITNGQRQIGEINDYVKLAEARLTAVEIRCINIERHLTTLLACLGIDGEPKQDDAHEHF